MRTQGHLRVTLNTKLWPEMTLERANEKSLRITGMDEENDVKIYLIMVNTNKCCHLFIINLSNYFGIFLLFLVFL